jgi:hypothetical protein
VRAWDHGELSGLVDATERALGQFTSQPTWQIIHGTVLAAAGDREGAQAVLADVISDDAIATVGGLARVTLGPVARYAGLAAYVAGDLDDAVDLLAAAERRCRDAHARPHLARTLYDRSCVHEQRGAAGDRTAADGAIAEARAIAGEIGLVLGDLGSGSQPGC